MVIRYMERLVEKVDNGVTVIKKVRGKNEVVCKDELKEVLEMVIKGAEEKVVDNYKVATGMVKEKTEMLEDILEAIGNEKMRDIDLAVYNDGTYAYEPKDREHYRYDRTVSYYCLRDNKYWQTYLGNFKVDGKSYKEVYNESDGYTKSDMLGLLEIALN